LSGHSKWSTIKRKKGKADAERGKVFTKLIKEIVVAARESGGDPDTNPRLRTGVQAARDANMPVSNIDKAIARGTGDLAGVVYESATFEGYALGGVAVLVESLTDNKNRTTAEVRHIFTKHGGHLGEPGSVAYMFESKGMVVIDQAAAEEDKVYEIALENGAEDIKTEDDHFEIICPPESFEAVREAIVSAGIEYQVAEVSLHPTTTVGLESDKAVRVLKLVSSLEDNEDVQRVSANFDISDEILGKIEDQI
jgi:YebC/PmpR family DNA-binding regulatory protein